MKSTQLIGLMVILLALGVTGPGALVGCSGHDEDHDHSSEAGHDDHGHDDDDHGHGHHEHDENYSHDHDSTWDLLKPVSMLIQVECEHKMPAYKCSHCRYRMGVVQVDASHLNGDPEEGGGLIKTQEVNEEAIDDILDVTGEIRLNESAAAHISPRIAGIIRSVHANIGSRVEREDILFEIDSVELGEAISDFEKSRAMSELSRRNFEREKSLHERRISSESDMIDAQMAYEQHQTEARAAEQKLFVLGLRRTDIATAGPDGKASFSGRLPARAPFDGTVIEKHAVVGELVEPGDDIMMVADLSTVWVWADIYEQDLAKLLAKKEKVIPVSVHVDAFPSKAFRGEIDYIGAIMEERTRTVKVRAVVKNEERWLRPGMFCDVRIELSCGLRTITVPKTAVLSDDGYDFIFKHLEGDYYIRRAVTTGRTFEDRVEVVEGIEPGEFIVADGAFTLKSDILREKMGAGCAD